MSDDFAGTAIMITDNPQVIAQSMMSFEKKLPIDRPVYGKDNMVCVGWTQMAGGKYEIKFRQHLPCMDNLPVLVPRDMWDRRDAKELGRFVDQLCIYDHVFVPPLGDWIPVSVDELIELGAVKMLTLHKDIH